MDQDKFALVEKIVKDVDNIMCRNAELSSFDIVPVESNFQNKSPVLHEENCLGLESWCVKHVYMYCYSEIFDKYFSKPKQKSPKAGNVDRLTKLLNMTILINPDVCSLWNHRRVLVLRNVLNKTAELRFTTLVLSRKPKCNDAFSYRRWILDMLFKDSTLQSINLDNLVTDELNICQLTADKSPNNYHSWSHRMWLLKQLKDASNNIDMQYIKEYEFSQMWISRHISDFSCFHYRQFCIKNVLNITSEATWKLVQDAANINLHDAFTRVITTNFPKDITLQFDDEIASYSDGKLLTLLLGEDLKECSCKMNTFLICRRLEILFHELVLSNELIQFYEHHETLWYHRRFIIQEILELLYGYFSLARRDGVLVRVPCACQGDFKKAKIVRYDGGCIYSSVLFRVLVSHEQDFAAQRRAAGDHYADRHDKYLKFVKGFKNTGN